ncbi:MAG: hypothetical protein ACOZNI_33110 [Myxococcota bacterium]
MGNRAFLPAILTLAVGCPFPWSSEDKSCEPLARDLSVSRDADVPTFATMSFTMAEPGDVTIHATASDSPEVAGPSGEGLEGEVTLPLRGMRPDSEYTVHVTDAAGCEATAEVTTGALEGEPVALDSGDEAGTHVGFLVLGWLATGTGAGGVTVLDREGGAVWHHGLEGGVSFAEPTPEEDGLLVLHEEGIETVDWTGAIGVEVAIEGAHGTATQDVSGVLAAALVQVTEEVPGTGAACGEETDEVVGETIVAVGTDGTVTEVWSSFDHWGVECGVFGPVSGGAALASVDYDPGRDQWLVASYDEGDLVWIDRGTGEEVFRVGASAKADCAVPLEGPAAAEWTDRGVALLDTGGGRAIELEVDVDAGTCAIVEEYAVGVSTTWGDVDVVDGRWYTAWGDQGTVRVFEDGAAIWEGDVDSAASDELGGVIAMSIAWLPDLYGG